MVRSSPSPRRCFRTSNASLRLAPACTPSRAICWDYLAGFLAPARSVATLRSKRSSGTQVPAPCALRWRTYARCQRSSPIPPPRHEHDVPSPGALDRDDFSSHGHPAPASCLSMIFSENRYRLFGIMLSDGDGRAGEVLARDLVRGEDIPVNAREITW